MENKTSKYFKYAIGEIILVVIGILIALHVNTWNEQRKSNLKERQYLESFKKDLEANVIELQRVIEKTEQTSKSSDSILQFKTGKLEALSLKEFVSCALNATGFTVFQTQEGTIQDIVGSGKLDIITNDSIRLVIGSWDAGLKSIREWEDLDKNSSTTYIEYLNQHTDTYKISFQNLPVDEDIMNDLIIDRIFLNRIGNRKRLPTILNNLYKKAKPQLEALIAQIDKELDK